MYETEFSQPTYYGIGITGNSSPESPLNNYQNIRVRTRELIIAVTITARTFTCTHHLSNQAQQRDSDVWERRECKQYTGYANIRDTSCMVPWQVFKQSIASLPLADNDAQTMANLRLDTFCLVCRHHGHDLISLGEQSVHSRENPLDRDAGCDPWQSWAGKCAEAATTMLIMLDLSVSQAFFLCGSMYPRSRYFGPKVLIYCIGANVRKL